MLVEKGGGGYAVPTLHERAIGSISPIGQVVERAGSPRLNTLRRLISGNNYAHFHCDFRLTYTAQPT